MSCVAGSYGLGGLTGTAMHAMLFLDPGHLNPTLVPLKSTLCATVTIVIAIGVLLVGRGFGLAALHYVHSCIQQA